MKERINENIAGRSRKSNREEIVDISGREKSKIYIYKHYMHRKQLDKVMQNRAPRLEHNRAQ